MNYSLHKNKVLPLSLLLLSGITAQSAHATSAYSSTATYTYTITATNTNLNSDSLAGLTIGGSIVDDFGDTYDSTLGYTPEFTSPSSSHSSTLGNFNSFGTAYTQVFHAEDNISDGVASSEYLGSFIQTFLNTSANVNDIFDITIDYSYTLSTSATGEDADTDINISLSDYDYVLGLSDFSHASTNTSNISPLPFNDSFSFTLATAQYNALFVDTQITGTLQATVAPVPVPAAFWLFGSALIALPGIRRIKTAI